MNLKKKSYFIYNNIFVNRQLFANFAIIISLSFVLFSNIHEIRFTKVYSESGTSFTLDRFTNKIIKDK